MTKEKTSKKFTKKSVKKVSVQSAVQTKLNLKQYEKFVTGLASERSMVDFNAKITTGAMGLAGESGEFADVVKKVLFHDLEYTEDVRQRLIKELGDVMWYVAFTARNVLGVGIREIIDQNVRKLSARYPSGEFTHEDFMRKELSE